MICPNCKGTGWMDATEALAEAWASIDGKLELFRACRADDRREEVGGYYQGYMVEAEEMQRRLLARGYTLVLIERPVVDGAALDEATIKAQRESWTRQDMD